MVPPAAASNIEEGNDDNHDVIANGEGYGSDPEVDNSNNNNKNNKRTTAQQSNAALDYRQKLKRARRLVMNRMSARERRRRKKMLIERLDSKVMDLTEQVRNLQELNTALQSHVQKLDLNLTQSCVIIANLKTSMSSSLTTGLATARAINGSLHHSPTADGLDGFATEPPIGAHLPGFHHPHSVLKQSDDPRLRSLLLVDRTGVKDPSPPSVLASTTAEDLLLDRAKRRAVERRVVVREPHAVSSIPPPLDTAVQRLPILGQSQKQWEQELGQLGMPSTITMDHHHGTTATTTRNNILAGAPSTNVATNSTTTQPRSSLLLSGGAAIVGRNTVAGIATSSVMEGHHHPAAGGGGMGAVHHHPTTTTLAIGALNDNAYDGHVAPSTVVAARARLLAAGRGGGGVSSFSQRHTAGGLTIADVFPHHAAATGATFLSPRAVRPPAAPPDSHPHLMALLPSTRKRNN